MLIANRMAGFTLGEADILRRAMSKKKKDVLEKLEDKFIIGSKANGYSEEKAHEIYNLILNFASYGFNKSHSVAYSIISYKMAYLKAHFPLYFYVSLLNSANMDEGKTKEYLREMKKHNIKISKPDINKSNTNYTVFYDTLYLPFSVIKGISNVIAQKIVDARGDRYQDIYDFFIKMVESKLPKNIYLSLVNSGSLDIFNLNRKTIIQNLDSLVNYGNLVKDLGKENVLKPEIINSDEYLKEELINSEKECFGFYLSNHPVTFYREKVSDAVSLSEIKNYFNKNVTCVLIIDRIKEITTKDGDKMAFLDCSDEESAVDIIVFPKVYESITNLKKSDIIKVVGKVERREDFSIIASSIINIKEIL